MKHTNGHHHTYIFLLISSRWCTLRLCAPLFTLLPSRILTQNVYWHQRIKCIESHFTFICYQYSPRSSSVAWPSYCEVWIALNISWHKNDVEIVIAHSKLPRTLLNAHSSIKYLSSIKINFHAPFTCSLPLF